MFVYKDSIKKKVLREIGKLTDDKFTKLVLERKSVLDAFTKITGRTVSASTLYGLLMKFRNPERYKQYEKNKAMTAPKKKEDKFKVFKSEFLLIIEGVGVYGFDDAESVKKAIEKMDSVAMLGRAVHLFSKRKVKVECKII